MLRIPDLSFPTLNRTLLGLAIGACGGGLIWASQAYFLPDPSMTPTGILLFAGLGGLVGYHAGQTRSRDCPQCGRSMGRAQNIRSDGQRATRPENQVNLRSWRTQGGGRAVEDFYLCEHCDQDFRLADLKELEAGRTTDANTLTADSSYRLPHSSSDSTSGSREPAGECQDAAAGRTDSTSEPTVAGISMPRGWEIEVSRDQLSIIRDDPRVARILGLVAFIGTLAVLFRYELKGLFFWLPFGVVFLVSKLVGRLLNEKVIINVCRGQLSIMHRPIPWPEKRVHVADIQQVYCAECLHSGSESRPSYFTYDVKLLTNGGPRKTLATGFKNKQHALAMECIIESFLGIEDREVDASFREQYKASSSLVRHLVVPVFLFLFMFLWFVAHRNEMYQDPAATLPSQSVEGRATSAKTTQDYVAEVAARTTLEEIRGSRWRQFHDRPSDLPDDEVLIEFRDDLTGTIRAKRGTRTLVDTQMTYEVSSGQASGQSLRITLSGGSEINARLYVDADSTKVMISLLSTNGKSAEQLGRYFQWQFPFERQPEISASAR